MIFGSVCSGIEAASVAWKPLGWRAAFASEIEAFPRAVLQHRHPETPLHGDFTTIQDGDYEPIDLLVGGTPCQSFSVAGLRGGLADERGNLALEYLRLADRLRSRWLVWENVPGVLSSNGGRDFGSILGGLGELGYGWSYRVLDAQYFGVPQRRRRVFVVGHRGDWRSAAAVLSERNAFTGDLPPSRPQGTRVAATIGTSVAAGSLDIFDSALALWSIMPQNSGRDYKARLCSVAQPLMAAGVNLGNQGGDILQVDDRLRVYTPRECERLQGFPDDYTLIPWRKGLAPDGPRYKALGNSMAVPVMAWIGRRIEAVEALTAERQAA